MNKWVAFTLSGIIISASGYSQNLPSLLSDRNINSTFSIIAYDENTREWGIAVATNNICVGNSTIYIQPGLGAFSVIAETEPAYAINGFEQLKAGKTIEQSIEHTRLMDKEPYYRQIAGIDANGNVYAFTGAALKYWQGVSAHQSGKSFVVLGNQLADHTLDSMAKTFETTKGPLAERLLKSLAAGQNAGGQLTGKRSAALVVKGSNNEWFNQLDLRIDNSSTPVADLQKLLNYHNGRIILNRSVNALKKGDKIQGEILLHKGETLVEGWEGIYSKIAIAYLLLGNEDRSVSIILKAISENPLWIENVPAFYCLYHHHEISSLKDVKDFSVKDWNNAISLLVTMTRNQAAIDLANKVLEKHPASSFTYYLLGKAHYQMGDKKTATPFLQKALQLDTANAEAGSLLKKLN